MVNDRVSTHDSVGRLKGENPLPFNSVVVYDKGLTPLKTYLLQDDNYDDFSAYGNYHISYAANEIGATVQIGYDTQGTGAVRVYGIRYEFYKPQNQMTEIIYERDVNGEILEDDNGSPILRNDLSRVYSGINLIYDWSLELSMKSFAGENPCSLIAFLKAKTQNSFIPMQCR